MNFMLFFQTKQAKNYKSEITRLFIRWRVTLTTLPGVGLKSAKALYEAGFKTTKSVIAADEKDLLAVSGVGINLVKKLKKLK